MDQHSFTLEQAHQYRKDAVTDGWWIKPAYPTSETMEQSANLGKEGFRMSIIARSADERRTADSISIVIWASDGLQITAPSIYSYEEICMNVRHCMNCHKDDVDTQRYSFAGRCCAECRPEMARIHEKPGWTN